MRSWKLVCWASVAQFVVAHATAQAPVFDGYDQLNELLPMAAASVDDFDGDGVRDLLVGGFTGHAYLYSGADHSTLFDFSDEDWYDAFGVAACDGGDIDGDGHHDYVVGAPRTQLFAANVGAARVFSGATGMVIRDYYGNLPDADFGSRVANAGDVDADGFADTIVGFDADVQYPASNLHRSSVFSGRTGAVLYSYTATGMRVCYEPAGDVDGDGHADLLRPEPDASGPNGSTGRVSIVSGATGGVLRTYQGAPGEQSFGWLCGFAGDFDRDGVPDALCGPLAVGTSNYVAILSGATGAELSRLQFVHPIGGLYGTRRAALIGDADADGTLDYVLESSIGRVGVASGLDGHWIYLTALTGGTTSLSSAGDLNHDGRDDLVLAGSSSDGTGTALWTVLLSNAHPPQRYCTATTNSVGCTPLIFWSGGGTSLTVGDALKLSAIGALASTTGFLVCNTAPSNVPFHGGTLCVSRTNARIVPLGASQPGLFPPCPNLFSFSVTRPFLIAQGLSAGTTVCAQFASRDPGFAPPNNAWFTDAVQFTVVP